VWVAMGMLGVVEPAAELLSFAALGLVVAAVVWFLIWNCLGPEKWHPLDYFSNKLRSQPYLFVMALFAVLGLPMLLEFFGLKATFLKAAPELALVVYLLGILVVGTAFHQMSAAGALVGALLYMVISIMMVVSVIFINPPFDEVGWCWSVMFLLLHMTFMLTVRLGVDRHLGRDSGRLLIPPGSEKLSKIWEATMMKFVPPMLLVVNFIFAILYKMDEGDYGVAFASTYFIVSTLVLLGCCVKAKEDFTAMEEDDEDGIEVLA